MKSAWFHLWIVGSLVSQSASDVHAYATFAKWGSSPVSYYINGQNNDVSSAVAEAAIQSGANAWPTQSNASIAFNYRGTTTDSVQSVDGRNLIFFRNASNGNAVASTYAWYSNGVFTDADIIFWDGAFTFFTGTSGCSGGLYIEDIAAHEFGHFLGMSHSPVPTATMVAATSYCSQDNRLLDPDDIAGIESLYPPAPRPRIVLTKSSNPSSIPNGDIATFSIQYQNTGTTNATTVAITDVIPVGSTLVPGSITQPTGVTSSVSGGVITWTVGSVTAAAVPKLVSFQVTANANLSNTANTSYKGSTGGNTYNGTSNTAGVTVTSASSPCDLDIDSTVTVADVQVCANQAIQLVSCTTGDINQDSLCNVVDVQRVVNATLGGVCVTQ